MTTPPAWSQTHAPFGYAQGIGTGWDHRPTPTPVLSTIPEQGESTGYLSQSTTSTSQGLKPEQIQPRPGHQIDFSSAYQAVDPYKLSVAHYANLRGRRRRLEEYPSLVTSDVSPVDDTGFVEPTMLGYGRIFATHTLPRQIYLHLLLRLPSMYWSRIARIFEEAEMSLPDIAKMMTGAVRLKPPTSRGELGLNGQSSASVAVPRRQDTMFTLSAFDPEAIPETFLRLMNTWEIFIDSMLKEWKILNIVSVLLLSAIVSILQIDSASGDPITRTAALISLVCALMSLLYGCMYSIRFYDMRKPHKAAQWAQEAQRKQSDLFWNVWVFLAMPAVWLAWSIVAYVVCIMAYVWRTGTGDTTSNISQKALSGLRVAISAVLFIGIVYFLLILNTLRRYGDPMDKQWRSRALKWIQEAKEKMMESQQPGERPRQSAQLYHPFYYPASGTLYPTSNQAWLSESARYYSSPAPYGSMQSVFRSGNAAINPPGFTQLPTRQWPVNSNPPGATVTSQSPWAQLASMASEAAPWPAPLTQGHALNLGSSAIYPTPDPRSQAFPPGFVPQTLSPSPGWDVAGSVWVPPERIHPSRSIRPATPESPGDVEFRVVRVPSTTTSSITSGSSLRLDADTTSWLYRPATSDPPLFKSHEKGQSSIPVGHTKPDGITTLTGAHDSNLLPEPESFSRPPPDELDAIPFLGIRIKEISPNRTVTSNEVPIAIANRDITQADWSNFIMDIDKVFPHNPDVQLPSPRPGEEYPGSEQRLFTYLHLWNTNFFLRRKTHVVFCSETDQDLLKPTRFALYLFDSSKLASNQELLADTRQSDELKRVDPIWPIYGEGPLSWIPSLGPVFSSNSPMVRFSAHPTVVPRSGAGPSGKVQKKERRIIRY
ncbi:hypothetical protein BDN72DRAFT_378687 [Pluteus cervinus]|uniref:Uncharacterized protein n=1 Tax=Pluteus cervinus TaxID=181527 RepID=A0ACD3B284_9AGAR|nr:hypothetical protein BDN72DRAFT_378687 [Pluteus cervinus]